MDRVKARLKTTPAVTCMKILLMIFIFIFWITGIAVLALGIWMKVDLFRYLELAKLYNIAAPWALIGVGSFIIIIGTLAVCCTVKGKALLLYLFAAFLMLVFLVELSAGIALFVFQGQLQDGFKSGLHEAVDVYGTNTDKQKAMDGLQKGLECCGVEDFTDWFASPWARDNVTTIHSTPQSCCIQAGCDSFNLPWPNANATIEAKIHTKGCHQKVTTFMQKNVGIIGGAAIGFAFIQFFGALLSISLAKSLRKATYEQVA